MNETSIEFPVDAIDVDSLFFETQIPTLNSITFKEVKLNYK